MGIAGPHSGFLTWEDSRKSGVRRGFGQSNDSLNIITNLQILFKKKSKEHWTVSTYRARPVLIHAFTHSIVQPLLWAHFLCLYYTRVEQQGIRRKPHVVDERQKQPTGTGPEPCRTDETLNQVWKIPGRKAKWLKFSLFLNRPIQWLIWETQWSIFTGVFFFLIWNNL